MLNGVAGKTGETIEAVVSIEDSRPEIGWTHGQPPLDLIYIR